MKANKTPSQNIADQFREQIKNISQIVAETKPLETPGQPFTREALAKKHQNIIDHQCKLAISTNKNMLARKLCFELVLLANSFNDFSDTHLQKIAWDIAAKIISPLHLSFQETADAFALLNQEKLDVNLIGILKNGFDNLTKNVVADIQLAILQSQTDPKKSAQFACDFDRMAAINTYFNALASHDKKTKDDAAEDALDAKKEIASIAIQEAMLHDYDITKQCVHSLFMSTDKTVFGDNWNRPASLTSENILDEPQFKKQVKDFYKQALMKEVKVVLSELQSTTDIHLDAVYNDTSSGVWDEGRYDMIFLKFDRETTEEVWCFQFENLEALRHKIGVMTVNKIGEITQERQRKAEIANNDQLPTRFWGIVRDNTLVFSGNNVGMTLTTLADYAEQMQGNVVFGETDFVKSKPIDENLIAGLTWQQILDAQQGKEYRSVAGRDQIDEKDLKLFTPDQVRGLNQQTANAIEAVEDDDLDSPSFNG